MQQTEQWFQQRCGMITASRFSDVLALSKTDGRPLKAREDYMAELVCERLTGQPATLPETYAMKWGNDNEPFARSAFEVYTGLMVQEVGFVANAEWEFTGCSPDGLIDDDGGLEIKCPVNSVNHLKCFISGVPSEHTAQIQGSMFITDRQWWAFASYDPRMPEHLRLYQTVVKRDDAYIDNLAAKIASLHREVNEFIAKLPKA
jgi:putative phage-type endonuclease